MGFGRVSPLRDVAARPEFGNAELTEKIRSRGGLTFTTGC